MTSNLPPGVSDSDIPGNRPEDAAWERFIDWIMADATQHGMDVDEVREVWNTGMVSWLRCRAFVRLQPGDTVLHPRQHGRTAAADADARLEQSAITGEDGRPLRVARKFTYDHRPLPDYLED